MGDATVTLAGKPALRPGPVRVTVEALVTPEKRPDIMEVLRGIWADRAARGAVSPTAAEVDARVAALRDKAEQRMREIERLQESCCGEGTDALEGGVAETATEGKGEKKASNQMLIRNTQNCGFFCH